MEAPAAGKSGGGGKTQSSRNMHTGRILLYGLILLFAGILQPASAIDFFFEPDTAFGEIGQVVQFSGRISESELMRGYTVYMVYDTNRIDLYEPPLPGALIVNQQGMQFNYFDHAPFQPTLLEIGATVFGTDFWQGPGEIFTMRMILRTCGNELIAAPYPPFFVAANETYPPVTYHQALVRICNVIPEAANQLTIMLNDPLSMILRWSPVTQDTSGFPLPASPTYVIVRQQVLPTLLPPENAGTTLDTFFVDPQGPGTDYIYHIITEPGE